MSTPAPFLAMLCFSSKLAMESSDLSDLSMSELPIVTVAPPFAVNVTDDGLEAEPMYINPPDDAVLPECKTSLSATIWREALSLMYIAPPWFAALLPENSTFAITAEDARDLSSCEWWYIATAPPESAELPLNSESFTERVEPVLTLRVTAIAPPLPLTTELPSNAAPSMSTSESATSMTPPSTS